MAIADYPWFLIPSQVSGRAWFCASNLTRAFLREPGSNFFFILSSFSANLVVDPEKHCNERKRCLVPVNKIWNIECNGMPSWQNFLFWATSIFHLVQVETFAWSNGKQKGNLNAYACKGLLRVISRCWRWREPDEGKDHKVSVFLSKVVLTYTSIKKFRLVR